MSSTNEMTDITQKRATGQIPCLECKRAKRKCDRKLPCSSCVLRNCAEICPNGRQSLAPRRTKQKLGPDSPIMATRILQLEEALRLLQVSVSSQPHPLLSEDLLQIKYGKIPNVPVPLAPEPSITELAESIGTLAISPYGDTKYFSPSAGNETLLHVGALLNLEPPINADDLFKVDEQYIFLSYSTTPSGSRSYLPLLDFLPAKPRAWALCETFLQQGCSKEKFVERDELIKELLIPTYDRQATKEQDPNFTAHKLAILFLVFSIGARADLTIPRDSDEADTYFQLGRTALSLHPILNSSELATIRALLLLAFCHMQGGRRYDVDVAYMLIAIAVKGAESIGLHRESSRWNLDEKTLHRRRHLWWEVFAFDTIMSFNLGRPPTIRASYIDCQYPDKLSDSTDDVESVADRWKRTFVREVMAWFLDRTTMPNVSYSTILEAHRRLEDFPIPPSLKVNMYAVTEEDDSSHLLYMKRHFPSHIVMICMLHIHRAHFVQTMLRHASDPLTSPYVTSFLASYKASSALIGMFMKHATLYPELFLRRWSIWAHLFAAAMVVGSIVVRSPKLAFAPRALAELGIVVVLFEKGYEECPTARSGLPLLRKLLVRATDVLSRQQDIGGVRRPIDDEDDLGDELAMFGGQSKVLVSNLLSQDRQRPKPVHPPAPALNTGSSAAHDSIPAVLGDSGPYEWMQDLVDIDMQGDLASNFSPEFMQMLMPNDSNPPALPQPGWDTQEQQNGINLEWLAFMEQAGFLDSVQNS